MSNNLAKSILAVGVISLVVGVLLSVSSNLIGTMQQGLNGATENALIFLIIGIVCLISGWSLRR
jgi:hypothetical protein